LIQSVIDSFKFELEKKKLKVNFEFNIEPPKGKPYYFKTDPEKVKLIISNLLSNAIKYSYEEREINVKVWEENERLNIVVEDQGQGISEENQKIIFDRFEKLDSGINSIHRGHGLGLSINKALLDLLNGDIDIQTEEEKGSAFSISIPEMQAHISGFAFDDNEMFFANNKDDEEDVF
jgi:signal transduction histidine kinase